MTISTSASQAVEELAYVYLPFLAEVESDPDEETIPLDLGGFHGHILQQIQIFREDGIREASDAHALGYYMDMDEGWNDIASSWETIVKEAKALMEEES
jgi:hypothetical protein